MALACSLSATLTCGAADWPQWGGHNERNFIAHEAALPKSFDGGSGTNIAEGVAFRPPQNIRWSAPLGLMTYSTPAVTRGRIFIGTNDQRLNDPRIPSTGGGLLLCLDEVTGRLIWSLPMPRLKTQDKQFNYDNIRLGVCSSPSVEGDRIYVVSSRGEVLCLDASGQADGNDGPYRDEGAYFADDRLLPAKPGRFDPASAPPPRPPVALRPTDGDIIWLYDFVKDLDVWPQDAVDCSILVLDKVVIVCTSNGVDKSHTNIPSPHAPDLIVLDKATGRLLAVNDRPIGTSIFHGEWSSPSLAVVNHRPLVLWGGGDGFCYAFDPRFEPGKNGAPGVLHRVWWFDCNPPENRFRDGLPLPYNKNHEGPCELMATPVFVNGKVYVTIGQDSRHGDGPGCFSCIDPSGEGDITQSGRVWQFPGARRSFSSASVSGGLVFLADYPGNVYCLDALTGKLCWQHALNAGVFGSTLVADGKVYIGDDKGRVTVFALDKEKKILAVNRLDSAIYTTPVAANGTLYIATERTLYACRKSGGENQRTAALSLPGTSLAQKLP